MNPTRPVATRAGLSTSVDGSSAVTATRFAFGFTFDAGSGALPVAGRDGLGRDGAGAGSGTRPHRPSATGEGR
jgi:hypothetical protein